MDRVAVFVDAGHLFAGGSALLSGEQRKRQDIKLDVPAVVRFLMERSGTLSGGLPLLRIYWYDGALPAGPTTTQRLLSSHDNVKLRLGVVNGFGEQKGVDAKIVTELVELARNRAICDAVLVAGDEDIRVGVELAQEKGVRIHLLTVDGSGVSYGLRAESDTSSSISKDDLARFMSISADSAVAKSPQAPSVSVPASVQQARPPLLPVTRVVDIDYQAAVNGYLNELAPEDRDSLCAAIVESGTIPAEHDGKILARTRDSIHRQLERSEIQALRKEFRGVARTRTATSKG